MFKIVRGADNVTWHREPLWSQPRETKRSQLRREIVSSCQQRHHFFTNCIANKWNELPDEIIESRTVEVFKSNLDDFPASSARARGLLLLLLNFRDYISIWRQNISRYPLSFLQHISEVRHFFLEF